MLANTPFCYLACICDHMKIKILGLEGWDVALWISPIRHESLAKTGKRRNGGGSEMTGKIKSFERGHSLLLVVLQKGGGLAGSVPLQGCGAWDADGSESGAEKVLKNTSGAQCPIAHCHTLRMTMHRSITAKKGSLQFTLADNDFGQSRGMGVKRSPRALRRMKTIFLCNSLEKAATSCHREVGLDNHQVLPDTASSSCHSASVLWSWGAGLLQVMNDTPPSWQLRDPSSSAAERQAASEEGKKWPDGFPKASPGKELVLHEFPLGAGSLL